MKNKILFSITKSEIGGAQKWISNLVSVIDNADFYLFTSGQGWLSNKFSKSKVTYFPSLSKMNSVFLLFEMIRKIKEINPDVIVSNSANAGVYTRVAAFLCRKKSIYVSHGWSCIYQGKYFRGIYCLIETMLSKITDKIICVSENDYFIARNVLNIDESKLELLPNSVPSSKPIYREKLRSETIRGLFLSRLEFPKRVDLLYDLPLAELNVTIDVIGGGSYRDKYIPTTEINYIGEVSDFSSFSDYDFFILLSDSEGLPMSALEAAEAGLPLFLSNVGGCKELTLYGNGVLVNNISSEITQQLREFLGDLDEYKKNSNRCRENFQIETTLNRFNEVLLDVSFK